ncbi:MAG: SLC13 family permease [Candidatus Caldarchaeum sp.]|uniref:Citrate transporter-like domain-containing protein n=1 Tax=Caldiarchaeum subterraneum TaxID=311458 RepID=A0A7J3VT05_CALS0
MNKIIRYAIVLAGVYVLSILLKLNTAQTLSLIVLGGLIGATLLFWRFRLVFAFFALTFMLAANLIDVELLIEYAHLDTILFLASMMIVVGYLEEARFFEFVIDKLQFILGNRPRTLVVFFMIMSAVLVALVDEVTSILIMVAILLDFTTRYNLNPVNFIMMSIFATNIGSAATVIGNPVGILIAFQADLGFLDFLRWSTPISAIALIVCIAINLYLFRRDISQLAAAMNADSAQAVLVDNDDKPDVRLPAAVFLLMIATLVLHAKIEEVLGLEKNVMLLGVPLFFAGFVLLLERDRARELVERRIDWWTLLFFMTFFASVGTLVHTGATKVFAEMIVEVGRETTIIMPLLTVLAGLMSAFMDNVLAVATWIPVIKTLGEFGINAFPLWWTLLFAGTFWGNLTIIGSTANIVAVGLLEKRERIHITLRQWIVAGSATTFPTVLIAFLLLLLQTPLMV